MVDAQLSINLFDAIVFGILFLLGMLSMFRGFIREALSLMAWVGAAMITLHSVEGVTNFLLPYMNENKFAATIFATMGTYFLALISISMFGGLILRYVKEGAEVGFADNALGLAFGLFKGWLIITLGFLIMSFAVKDNYPEWVQNAYTLSTVESSAETLGNLLPGYLQDLFSQEEDGTAEDVLEDLNQNMTLPSELEESPAQSAPSLDDLGSLIDNTEEN